MKKKWFTLIEMMIVIVIVAILLALTLWISGNRIQTLKNKSIQEQFVYKYNTLFSRNLLTNYYNWQLYNKMTIHLVDWENKISYSYKNDNVDIFSEDDNIQWGWYEIKELTFGELSIARELTDVDINFEPYVLWCELSGWNTTWDILKMRLLINDNEEFCIKINSDLCKLERQSCQ
jgi:prepilin-type N-terminal cleavage/methylation domain-containing protein